MFNILYMFVLDFHLCVHLHGYFACGCQKLKRMRDTEGGKRENERKMNRIVATHIHNLYLISIYDVPSISIWAENRIECRLVYVYRF